MYLYSFDNIYHKISGLYNAWLKKYKNIQVVDVLTNQELENLIKINLNCEHEEIDTKFMKNEFMTLTQYILNIMEDTDNV